MTQTELERNLRHIPPNDNSFKQWATRHGYGLTAIGALIIGGAMTSVSIVSYLQRQNVLSHGTHTTGHIVTIIDPPSCTYSNAKSPQYCKRISYTVADGSSRTFDAVLIKPDEKPNDAQEVVYLQDGNTTTAVLANEEQIPDTLYYFTIPFFGAITVIFFWLEYKSITHRKRKL